jgi:undecaprenyl-diphosphatase
MKAARSLASDRRTRIALIAAAIAGGYFLVKALLPEIDLQDLLREVARVLGEWTYLLVGAFAFLETGAFVGLVVPGETVVILGGAVAGVGETSLWITMGVVWFAAWAGDTVSFMLGRRLGRGFVVRHGPRFRLTPDRFAGVERYFENHGGKTILAGRFIGFVRALGPFIAGSSGMRYRAFVPYSVLGTGLWGPGFTLVGFFASRSLDEAAKIAGQGTLLFGIAVGVVVAVVAVKRFLREQRNRDRLIAAIERRPQLRPLLPLARRLWGESPRRPGSAE